MKKKEKQSLRSMSDGELTKQISVLEMEITKGRIDRIAKPVKNIRLYRAKRRQIAVAKTILHERAFNA